MSASIFVSVQADDFDLGEIVKNMRQQTAQVGAIASFVGTVRDINDMQQVATLELEHYPGMTEHSIQAICEQADQRWQLFAATVIHRIGKLAPTDQIVVVAVSSMHRGDAFEACEFIMDYLKTQAPFWKKELTPKGERWVDARCSDQQAAERWSQDS